MDGAPSVDDLSAELTRHRILPRLRWTRMLYTDFIIDTTHLDTPPPPLTTTPSTSTARHRVELLYTIDVRLGAVTRRHDHSVDVDRLNARRRIVATTVCRTARRFVSEWLLERLRRSRRRHGVGIRSLDASRHSLAHFVYADTGCLDANMVSPGFDRPAMFGAVRYAWHLRTPLDPTSRTITATLLCEFSTLHVVLTQPLHANTSTFSRASDNDSSTSDDE